MKDIDDSKAPLLDHLIELRRRLLWCVATLLIAFFVCLYFAKPIFAVLVQPLLKAGQGKLIYTDIFEAFFVEVKVAFFAALMISFPVLATQIWRFVAPGLYAKEKKAFLPFLLMTPFFFAGGVSFAYFLTVPWALHFLLGYQGNVGGVTQEALPGVGNYLNFCTRFLFGFGVAFLLPVLLMVLERAGIVTREQLAASRRYAIVGAAGVSAVLTPPDVVSMLMLLVPLYLLYEFAIVAIRLTHWRASRRAASAASGSQSVQDAENVEGPEAPPGGGGLAVPGPFKRIARAGGQKVTIRTAQRPIFQMGSTAQKIFEIIFGRLSSGIRAGPPSSVRGADQGASGAVWRGQKRSVRTEPCPADQSRQG
ncbi:twin-arginine translocase subunit TatC [Sphingomonas piscis]|uniref:Sec-independent protein translocase protein TatC n=1 Tax=Sphingomonas piscis TaxID=2714943 RepID=A0A6G7YR79_9SPHN|nr:twin-arginine translocase subunit TatC [Sphingomonas piscis]